MAQRTFAGESPLRHVFRLFSSIPAAPFLCSAVSFDQTDSEEQGCRKRGEEGQIKAAVGCAEADGKVDFACDCHDVPG